MPENKSNNETNETDGRQQLYKGFMNLTEDEKLWAENKRSNLEKLQLLTKMFRRNNILINAKISRSKSK
jgi:hypothetical protein